MSTMQVHATAFSWYDSDTEHMNQEHTETPRAERLTPHQPHENTGWAVVAYLIFFLPLLTDAKEDPYVKYHIKQGFVLFLAGVCTTVLSVVPPIMLVGWLLHLGIIVLAVIGCLNALNRKQQPLPLIGQFADRFHF